MSPLNSLPPDRRGHAPSRRPSSRASAFAGWAVGPVFVALTAWFLFAAPHADVPRPDAAAVACESIAPGARRRPMRDPPTAIIGGFEQRCNGCHRFFDSPPMARRTLTQHTHITLNHGMNSLCLNCHDEIDREKLVLYTGETVGFDQTPRLCAQCHGTVYRDWERGMHGKTMGSWDAHSGLQSRLACNECHDPHTPAYPVFRPLPPPNTLRMGEQGPAEHNEHSDHLPLRRPRAPAHTPETHP